jgi:hypothetical protein
MHHVSFWRQKAASLHTARGPEDRAVAAWPPLLAISWALLLAAILVSGCGGGGGSGGGDGNDAAPPQAPASDTSPGFTIEVAPAPVLAFAGSARLVEVTLRRREGFSADVTVAPSELPAGVQTEAVVFSGAVESRVMLVRLDDDVAPGTLALALTGSGGGLTGGATLRLAVQAPQPDAQQNIAEALANQRIDRDTALLYRLYALHGDPRLPDAYVGSGSAQEDLQVFGEVEAAWPQMSAAMQASVRPFMVRPDHPESIYRRPGSTPLAARLSAGQPQTHATAAPPPATCAAGAPWRSVRSASIPVRIWTECNANAGITAWDIAEGAKDLLVFEKIWPGMTALMGAPRLDGDRILDAAGNDITDNGGDDAIDVYLVGSYSISRAGSTISAAALGRAVGHAQPAGGCVTNTSGTLSCSGYMVLPSFSAGTVGQRSTIIHEFFHVLQFRANTSLATVAGWFYEASATWAESHFDRVLAWDPKVALTEVHRPRFARFLSVDESVNASGGLRPYAAYIWPFFLEQETGSSAIIGQIWTALQAAKTAADEDRIIDAAYSFDAHFHRFALRNVNEELLPGNPIPKRYIDLAGSAAGVKQFPDGRVTPRYKTRLLAANVEETMHYFIEPWSAEYARFLADGQAPPNRVEFDFSGITGRGNLKLDALVRTTGPAGDEWVSQPIPLDPDSKAVFCFELGTSSATVRGQFSELRLVLSNSASDRGILGDMIVRPTGKPCGVWEGTVATTIEFDLFGGGKVKMTSRAQVAFEFDEAASAGARQQWFQLHAGNFTYEGRTDLLQRNPPCRGVSTASGPLRPQNSPFDLGDGASAGTLVTFVDDDGKPRYRTGGLLAFSTATTVDNCNDRNVDVTSSAPMSSIVLWVPQEGMTFDLSADGRTMQGTRSITLGTETRTSTWLLTKKGG